MKNLELNNYGVQEMSTIEMSEIDGGALGLVICGIILLCALAAY